MACLGHLAAVESLMFRRCRLPDFVHFGTGDVTLRRDAVFEGLRAEAAAILAARNILTPRAIGPPLDRAGVAMLARNRGA